MNIEQFSKEHLSAVLDALIRVKGGEVDDDEFGICYNAVTACTYPPSDVLNSLYCGWGKFSGDEHYPIPSPVEDQSPDEVYNLTGNLWEGKYGALRYELLDFLIDELTKVGEKCNG